MKNKTLKGWILMVVCSSILSTTFGQKKNPSLILPGPKGAVMAVFGFYKNPKNEKMSKAFPKLDQSIVIYKKVGNKKKFEKIATIGFPETAAEFEKRLGKGEDSMVMKKVHADNMSQAYQTIKNYGTDTLGLLMIAPEIQEALGLFYTDKTWEKGQKVTYRFDRTEQGKTEENIYSETLDGSVPQYDSKLHLGKHTISYQMASGEWRTGMPNTRIPMFAKLYSYNDDTKEFEENGNPMLLQATADSVVVNFTQEIDKGSNVMWYVRLMDRAGNLGTPSDTMYGISIDKNNIAFIEDLTVTDTSEGLLLQWKPLPQKVYYTGIQVLKSRQFGKDYVVLDTLSPQATSYLDHQVITGSEYYYKVRPLLYSLANLEPVLFSDASGRKAYDENQPPSTPQGLKVSAERDSIRLSWLSNPEFGIFGYYILRGTSMNNMEVIDGPVKTNHYIDTVIDSKYSGTYVYAIQVMNLNQDWSDTSDVASIQVRQPVVLPSPGGIQAESVPKGVSLRWQNTRVEDNSIVGYIVYRMEKGEKKYQSITNKPVPLPGYLDSTVMPATHYEYAVSSIDVYGNQSILSPMVSVQPDMEGYLDPPSSISLRNIQDGIELSWAKPYDIGNRRYVIYRKEGKDGSFSRLATVNPEEVYVDQSTKNGALYSYKVAVQANQIEGSKSRIYMVRRR